MLRDVIFNNKSAYDDFGIVLIAVDIPLPMPKTFGIDIKGANGTLDLTEVNGYVKYTNRVIKLQFEVLDDYDYKTLISKISDYLHGQKVSVRFTDDYEYFYVGRAVINQHECIERKGVIVISVDCEPYKYTIKESVNDIQLADEMKTLNITTTNNLIFLKVEVSGDVYMLIDDVRYPLIVGVQDFTINKTSGVVKFEGNGTVRASYRTGVL